MVIFHCYVSLPEGNTEELGQPQPRPVLLTLGICRSCQHPDSWLSVCWFQQRSNAKTVPSASALSKLLAKMKQAGNSFGQIMTNSVENSHLPHEWMIVFKKTSKVDALETSTSPKQTARRSTHRHSRRILPELVDTLQEQNLVMQWQPGGICPQHSPRTVCLEI